MDPITYLRQFRIGNFAIFDFSIAFLGMLLVSPLLSWLFNKIGILVPKKNWVILTLPISVLVHIIIGNITPFTQDFLDPSGHYFIKFIILGCCVLAGTGIKRAAPTVPVKKSSSR